MQEKCVFSSEGVSVIVEKYIGLRMGNLLDVREIELRSRGDLLYTTSDKISQDLCTRILENE